MSTYNPRIRRMEEDLRKAKDDFDNRAKNVNFQEAQKLFLEGWRSSQIRRQRGAHEDSVSVVFPSGRSSNARINSGLGIIPFSKNEYPQSMQGEQGRQVMQFLADLSEEAGMFPFWGFRDLL